MKSISQFYKLNTKKQYKPHFTLTSGKRIYPYSDLLLHDMGEDLNDNRREFLADPSEWRTAPLWGIGKNTNFSFQFICYPFKVALTCRNVLKAKVLD